MTDTLKNILVGIVFILLLVLGYYMISQNDAINLSFDGATLVSDSLLAKTQAFIDRGATLKTLDIKTDFLSDERFTSLHSYSTKVPDQSVGRVNIFDAPISVPTTRTPVVQ